MTADILTKLLEPDRHWQLLEALGVIAVPPEREQSR